MPTLFRVGAYRIVIHSNDHPPPHVHAIGDGSATFESGFHRADIRLVACRGIALGDLRRLATEIANRHHECQVAWRNRHGS
jgi:hypothetical protein